jgi:flagellar basal body rod protein FlgC
MSLFNTSVSGVQAASIRQAVSAHDVANVNTGVSSVQCLPDR